MPSLSDIKVHISTDADTKGIEETERALGGFSTRSAAVMGLVSGAAQSLVNNGINLITSSIGDAVKRVDTLNNAGRTFENMGFSAQATKVMMHDLDLSIRGLPTSLSDAVSNVELLTGSTQDIGKSRKIFDALNDGILGFGGSAEQVNGAIIQISQAFSNGKIDAQTWNSLIQNGMGPALNVLAKQMGMTTGAFKEGLSNGSISVQKFQDALVDLDTKGGGGMASLHKIALDSTAGIGTGIQNAKTAVVRGMADIIQAVGTKRISEAITEAGKAFETFAKQVPKAVTEAVTFLKQHHMALSALAGIITALVIPAFVGLATAIWLAVAPLIPVIALGALLGGAVQILVTHLGGWHKVLKDIQSVLHPLLSDLDKWYTQMGGLHGIIHTVHEDVFHFVDVMRQLWDTFKQSTPVTIIVQYFQQVMLPALKAIWNSITKDLMPAVEGVYKSFKRLYDALEPGLTGALKVLGVIVGIILFAAIWLLLSALNLFIKALGWVESVVTLVIDVLANLISWFGNLVGVVINTVKSIISIFKNLWPAFKDVVSLIGSAVGAVGGLLLSPFKWGYDQIINLFKNLPKELGNLVSSAVSGAMNSAKSGLSALHLPHFASGVRNFSGGMALVGEQGPELVSLPQGSNVYSNNESGGMMGGGNTTSTYNIQSVVLSSADATAEFFKIQDRNGVLASKGLSIARAY